MKFKTNIILFSFLFITKIILGDDYSLKLKNEESFKPYKNSVQDKHFVIQNKSFENTNTSKLKDDPIIGKIRFLDLFECKNLVYKRGIFIWFPENYSKDNGPYSVVYFHDAQNLFLPSESFSNYDWKVDETISSLMKEKIIKPCIVVAIPNSPKREEELNLETDEGKAYSKFIIDEIIPFIKKNYPVSRKRKDHIIAGSSLGGLMSFQMAYYNPQIFGGAICMSSAFHHKISNIIDYVKKTIIQPLNIKIYIDTGELETKELDGESIVSLFYDMNKILKEKGFKEDINLKSYFHKKASHSEKFWAERLYIPLTFMLKK